jgi:hypothetical protein
VYTREAHPADGENAVEVNKEAGYAITKPVSFAERTKLANQAVERLKIAKQRVVVDAWSDATYTRYGGYPNMTFVIDKEGKLQAGHPWMDVTKVKGALDALLAGKEVPGNLRGKTQATGPGELDLEKGSQQMGGYRGAALALTLDRLTLTDKQKVAIYPALGEYLAEQKDFREKYGARGAAGGGPKGAAGKAGEMMEEAGGGEKAVSAEEFAKAMAAYKEKAQTLKKVLKEQLPEKDSKELLEILSQGPAKRVFAD